jgi:hypothetical protein
MLHKCSHAFPNGCKKEQNSLCKYGYDTITTNKESSFDEKGYPVYFRPKNEDLNVVPHNKEILLDWNGHSNVEFCGKTYAVLYLYNYLFKGNQKIKFNLNNIDDVNEKDEIKLYLRGRMLSAMDACWRIFGYQTYPASQPSVVTIKAKNELEMILLLNDGKLCDLAVYFNRPINNIQFNDLTYSNFFKYWEYSYTKPKRFESIIVNNNKKNGDIFEINCFLKKPLFVFKRLKNAQQIVRIGMLYITVGELWYLRLLLLNKSAYSHSGIKIVDGYEYPTFQMAAIKLNFNEGKLCFIDAINIGSSPQQLRNLFISLTLQGYVTLIIFTNRELKNYLYQDLLLKFSNNYVLAENELLKILSHRFKQEKKCNSDFGLPEPEDDHTELQIEKLNYDPIQQTELLHQLLKCKTLTNEQSAFF